MDRPCIYESAGTNNQGYRRVRDGDRQVMAHRLAWERANGRRLLPWPQETVDHLCHNEAADCPGGYECPHRACIEPTHLAVATVAENWRNGRRGAPAMRAALTKCLHGHPFSGANVKVRPDGARECRACKRARAAGRVPADEPVWAEVRRTGRAARLG